MGILDYFDRLAIIHLPEREDRYHALRLELLRIGIDITGPKVSMPTPPMPDTSNGFPSRGVYGNLLSHLEIIENAYQDGLDTVWVIEDDAIFSKRFQAEQVSIAQYLRTNAWDQFFIGHSVPKGLPRSPTGLLSFSGPFLWAHCYAVHRRIMPRLSDYLRKTIDRGVGHPDGGKMYIDAAFCLFRRFNPDVTCIVSSPCLSVQKGSPSSLNRGPWYDKNVVTTPIINLARQIRDESWRQGWTHIAFKDDSSASSDITSPPARTWPSPA